MHNVILCHLALFEFYFKFIGVFRQKIFYLKICIEMKKPSEWRVFEVIFVCVSLESACFWWWGHSAKVTQGLAAFAAITVGFFTEENLLFMLTPLAVLGEVCI